jgi:hypothetical protein
LFTNFVFHFFYRIIIPLNGANRPLKRFDDGVDVGRFIRDGNEESEKVVSPWQGEINDLAGLQCGDRIVDQQIALL